MTYPNWFESTDAKANFERNLLPLADKEIKCLQVGAYTGDATKWMVDNILKQPDSFLVDVDTWEGSDEAVHHNMDWQDVFKTYSNKNAKAILDQQVVVMQMTSDKYFAGISNEHVFDFIYVDADHTTVGVLMDAELAWPLLKPGGILAFDDYQWGAHLPVSKSPKLGIDLFLERHLGEYEILEQGLQVWLRKL
jgi:hypothetical protein